MPTNSSSKAGGRSRTWFVMLCVLASWCVLQFFTGKLAINFVIRVMAAQDGFIPGRYYLALVVTSKTFVFRRCWKPG